MAFDPPLRLYNQTFTVAVISLNAETTTNYTISGAQVGMGVIVNTRGSSQFGPLLYAWVSAANTITVAYRALVAANLSSVSVQIDIHVIA